MSLSGRLYKEEAESQIEDDDDSVNSAEDIGDALILNWTVRLNPGFRCIFSFVSK